MKPQINNIILNAFSEELEKVSLPVGALLVGAFVGHDAYSSGKKGMTQTWKLGRPEIDKNQKYLREQFKVSPSMM